MVTAYTPASMSPPPRPSQDAPPPAEGEVVAKVGEAVTPETVVAQTQIPGILRTVSCVE
jgi:hypothetical protein